MVKKSDSMFLEYVLRLVLILFSKPIRRVKKKKNIKKMNTINSTSESEWNSSNSSNGRRE